MAEREDTVNVLKEAGAERASVLLEESDAVQTIATVIATVTGAGGLSTVLIALINRHKDTRVVSESGREITGASLKEIKKHFPDFFEHTAPPDTRPDCSVDDCVIPADGRYGDLCMLHWAQQHRLPPADQD
ncbi:MAG: hypothetical protein LBV60_12095 [Streptomyces sp.]|jgi:hypothetical protein|nr:hypothetical protein [Streptomyces sp.]